jgi:hypothetical protein
MRTFAVSAGLSLLLIAAPGHADSIASAAEPAAAAVKAAPRPFPFARWDALLGKHVDERGRVRYADIDAHAVDALLAALDASSPHHDPALYPTKAAQLAYFIDGYNVAMWANVLRRPHLESVIDDKKAIFETTLFYFGGEPLTLQKLEERVRKLGGPRVHMALNCASASCPELPRHAFTPEGLDAQLDEAARRFCNDPRNVAYDAKTNTASLSKIFDWYAADFGDVIGFIDRYRTQKVPAGAHVTYVEYDWRLNDQGLPR